MPAAGTATIARATRVDETDEIGMQRADAAGRDRERADNPYSAVLCVALLLLGGLLIKGGPAIHALLAQN